MTDRQSWSFSSSLDSGWRKIRGFKFHPGLPKLVRLVLARPKMETMHSDQLLPGPRFRVQVKLWAHFSGHRLPSLHLARLLKLTATP